MPEKIKLALLWHMHQPFYKDSLRGLLEMPWVRLHALKDYWGMVAMLDDFPRARMTFNVVPSLLSQIEDFLAHPEVDPLFTLAFQPVSSLTDDQKLSMLENFFQANYEHQIARFPRFEELFQRAHQSPGPPSSARLRQFGAQDLLDLQVLSQLCWFDEIYLTRDPVTRSLVEKGRRFSDEDKARLRDREVEILSHLVPIYRQAAERGQVELSTTPFFHPILPLLCDSSIASQSQPRSPFPAQPFRYPQDAALQLNRAVEQHQRLFGQVPSGVWPSEGSVSNAALDVISDAGFLWTATDEGILARSLGLAFHRAPSGEIHHSEMLHAPYRYRNTSLHIFFRDRELSDAIGFHYSRMPAGDAAENFVHRVKSSVKLSRESAPCVSVILDGENAWDYFPENGRPFLKALYQRLTEDPGLEMVTFSEACAQLSTHERRLENIWPGSWINSDFSIWIGDPEDNRAWELLSETREAMEIFTKTHPDFAGSPRGKAAWESLLAAEGSDWCWWYGPEHSTVNDFRFDRLFRSHLINCYQQMGLSIPGSLAQPLKRQIPKRLHILPLGRVHPSIDGRVSSYFEWMGAGSIEESQSTMHQGRKSFERLLYGWDEENVFIRIDLPEPLLESHPAVDVRLYFDADTCLVFKDAAAKHVALSVLLREEKVPAERAVDRADAEPAFDRMFEARIRKSLWPAQPGGALSFYVLLEIGGVPVERIPMHGNLRVDDTSFE
ncbi:MAG: glycoside hydrolase [Acidobacteriia bacterium]|nr:glycoside hydrolase [Terriglobia bacterium]